MEATSPPATSPRPHGPAVDEATPAQRGIGVSVPGADEAGLTARGVDTAIVTAMEATTPATSPRPQDRPSTARPRPSPARHRRRPRRRRGRAHRPRRPRCGRSRRGHARLRDRSPRRPPSTRGRPRCRRSTAARQLQSALRQAQACSSSAPHFRAAAHDARVGQRRRDAGAPGGGPPRRPQPNRGVRRLRQRERQSDSSVATSRRSAASRALCTCLRVSLPSAPRKSHLRARRLTGGPLLSFGVLPGER